MNKEDIEKVNFNDYAFRCHALGNLMTEPTGKTPMKLYLDTKEEFENSVDRYDKMKTKTGVNGIKLQKKIKILAEQLPTLRKNKDTVLLSQTTISYLERIFIEEVFGKKKNLSSKFLDKGLQQEQDSFSLYSSVLNTFLKKNEERKTNKFLTGEPDNIQDGLVRDFKTSWEMNTFPIFEDVKINKGYYWQLQGYMFLFDLEKAELVYCLVDTPDLLIEDEIRREGWKNGFIEIPEEMEEEIRNNLTFSEIPEKLRIKNYYIERNQEDIEKLKKRIFECRKYLNQLKERTLKML